MENLVYYEYAFNYLQLFIWTLREFWLEWDLKEVILYCCRIVKHDMNKSCNFLHFWELFCILVHYFCKLKYMQELV